MHVYIHIYVYNPPDSGLCSHKRVSWRLNSGAVELPGGGGYQKVGGYQEVGVTKGVGY